VLDADLLRSIAAQLMQNPKAERTSRQHLKRTSFTMNGREYQAIEQNAAKPSRWGQLARAGHEVVQFKDARRNRFVAVAVDGKVIEYGGRGRRNER
jgi:hypothetical protein